MPLIFEPCGSSGAFRPQRLLFGKRKITDSKPRSCLHPVSIAEVRQEGCPILAQYHELTPFVMSLYSKIYL